MKARLTLPRLRPLARLSSTAGPLKDGKARIVGFFSKKARGAMARHIVQKRLTDPVDLQGFTAGGYRYEAEGSNGEMMLFMRDYPKA